MRERQEEKKERDEKENKGKIYRKDKRASDPVRTFLVASWNKLGDERVNERVRKKKKTIEYN